MSDTIKKYHELVEEGKIDPNVSPQETRDSKIMELLSKAAKANVLAQVEIRAEEVKKEFALNYRFELNGKFQIAHYSFDNSRQRWVYKVVLLVNTKYLNRSFIEIICKTLDNVACDKSASESCAQTTKANTTPSKSNIKKKSHRTLILAIAFVCFFPSCAAVAGFLYFEFPFVFQQITELIFSLFS